MRAYDPLRRIAKKRRSALWLAGCAAVVAGACQTESSPPAGADASSNRPTADVSMDGTRIRPATPVEPDGGVVRGRLANAVTGRAVPGVAVNLQSHGRQVASGPDGRFRFDGVEQGPVSVRVAPNGDYVPRALSARMGDSGIDLGLVTLLPEGPPALIVPEYGGVAEGCGPTQLAIATDVLADPIELRVTCLGSRDPIPGPPPSDRLTLAVVHLSPTDLELTRPALLTVALPIEPRFRSGTLLDLYRLNFDTLQWEPYGEVEVALGASAAQGTVPRLGTYAVAAPPFGSMSASADNTSSVGGVHTTSRPGGPLAERFDPSVALVYLAFDFAAMENTTVGIVTTDESGAVLHSSKRPYTGEGHDDVPMVYETGWPPGRYETEVRLGEATLANASWTVGETPSANAAAAPGEPTGTCRPPPGWYPHVIRAGDTLFGLGVGQQLSVADLQEANCLIGETILAGQTIYLPTPHLLAPALAPDRVAPPPVRWIPPDPGGGGSRPPWPAFPPASPPPENPSTEPTLAIRPTTPPLP